MQTRLKPKQERSAGGRRPVCVRADRGGASYPTVGYPFRILVVQMGLEKQSPTHQALSQKKQFAFFVKRERRLVPLASSSPEEEWSRHCRTHPPRAREAHCRPVCLAERPIMSANSISDLASAAFASARKKCASVRTFLSPLREAHAPSSTRAKAQRPTKEDTTRRLTKAQDRSRGVREPLGSVS